MTQGDLFHAKRTPTEPNEGTQKARILALLRDGGIMGACNTDMNDICFRYAARIHELRTVHGFDIETGGTMDGGIVWYRLRP